MVFVSVQRFVGTKAALLFAVPLLFLAPLLAQAAETIDRYDVLIELKQDATFSVTETIDYDFGSDYRHGIYRDIPTEHPQPASSRWKERYIEFSNFKVSVDGAHGQTLIDHSGNTINVRIGDPDRTITGKHTYTISYDVAGGLHYYNSEAPELYWDAIGTEWQVPIKEANVTVVAPVGLLTGVSNCYQGVTTGNANCGAAEIDHQGETYTYSVSNLRPYEGVTVAFALASTVPVVVIERYVVWYFLLPIAILLLIGVGIGLYRYQTKFKTGNPIIPQYEPYQDFKPMYTGLLFDGRLDPKDITAGIVYLAQQGYLKIRKIEKKVLFLIPVSDYEILIVKDIDGKVSSFLHQVASLMFNANLKVGDTTSLSKLRANTSKQSKNQAILKKLKKSLEQDLKEQGFFQVNISKRMVGNVIVAMVLGMFFLPPLIFIILPTLVMVLALARRRTRKGYEALDYLKGFKDYLTMTEKDRYTFHNAPAKSPEQFMEYLPYAIAFGVEKEWAAVFKDITIPNPEWYDGGSTVAFSAVDLTQSLGAFSSAFATSSGSSGSGGGGSVGGGGGGGGGGSW